MYAITADQVDSRTSDDLVAEAIARLNARDDLVLAAERTAGDELQLLVADPGTALAIVLELTRASTWSVGCGVGEVVLPDTRSVRAASGAAFVGARDAVGRAKRKPTRFALGGPEGSDAAEALIDLLLTVRSKRTEEGWELADLLAQGLSQAAAASRLGITPQAASDRAIAGAWRVEAAAIPALTGVLARLEP